MLWHEGVKRIFVHPFLVPRLAVLDADLIAELPEPVIASSGLDAVSHAVESLLSTFATPLTTVHASAALETLGRSLLPAYDSKADSALGAMLFGAYQAGLALNASVVIGHSLAYTVAARTGLSHGVTCAMALPFCLAYCRPEASGQMGRAAALVGAGVNAEDLFRWALELNQALEIPGSLSGVGIGRDDLAAMAAECVSVYPRPNNPTAVDEDSVLALLGRFHDGDASGAWEDAA
jgi:alcohol dehydrogenase class IV